MLKTYTPEQLKEILAKHTRWLQGYPDGECANLSDADLSRANLSGANLSRANLSDADLSRANLSRANLSGANLSRANLIRANLSGANLRRADLSDADLSDADLSGAYLSDADLSDADLSGAYLSRANLSRADLSGANLSDADLSRANLSRANLIRAKLPPIALVPDSGSFRGWKKTADGSILHLEIPEDAQRVNSTGRKCRASKAKVIAAYTFWGKPSNETRFASMHDPSFVYQIGETVEVPNYNPDFREECTRGIHFFITRKEAEAY